MAFASDCVAIGADLSQPPIELDFGLTPVTWSCEFNGVQVNRWRLSHCRYGFKSYSGQHILSWASICSPVIL
jgi:hypothetical protein